MSTDRRAILSLIATGRISAREGERLLAVLPDEDDFILWAVICLAVLWLLLSYFREILTGVNRVFVSWFSEISLAAHHALICFTHWFGGLS